MELTVMSELIGIHRKFETLRHGILIFARVTVSMKMLHLGWIC